MNNLQVQIHLKEDLKSLAARKSLHSYVCNHDSLLHVGLLEVIIAECGQKAATQHFHICIVAAGVTLNKKVHLCFSMCEGQ